MARTTHNTNRSHLVPTVITNKNGVQTTVHKRPVSKSTSNTRLPMVTLLTPEAPTRDTIEHETAKTLTELHSHKDSRDSDYFDLRNTITTFSTETLHRLTKAAPTEIGFELLTKLLQDKEAEEFLNDWITVEPLSKELDFWSVLAIRGFSKYVHLEPQRKGNYPERREVQTRAIIRVTAHLEQGSKGITTGTTDKGNTVEYIKSQKLRHLLTTHDDPNAVADIIVTRNITNVDQITTLLAAQDATPTAIHDGIL